MNLFSRSVFLFLVTLIISACSGSSSDKTVEQGLEIKDEAELTAVCESLQEEAIRIAVDDFSVIASNGDYKLYLEDFFNSLSALASKTLASRFFVFLTI